MSLVPGARVGHYEVLAKIGAGGMGVVYKAHDTRLRRDVAIKVLPPGFSGDAERLRRFVQEARAAGSLAHPNVIVVYDIDDLEGAPYVVTELLEGEDLRERLSRGRLSQSRVFEFAIQIASGLAAAHERGIVHRDIKPANLFLTADGRIKILDFGLAKLTPSPPRDGETHAVSAHEFTQPGAVLGTASYMSPEQVRGQGVDHRSDIFSFGAVLYEMLCGRRAFQRDSVIETMGAVLREEPPSLFSEDANLSPSLERIVRHCLQKRADDRFQSARDLALALDATSLTSVSSSVRSALVASAPSFRKVTFRRGNLLHARFTPDGKTVVYSAAWDGEPSELYMSRIDGRESRRLGIANADLLSVSGSGELAVLLKKDFLVSPIGLGTLARVPIGGGSPREMLEDVVGADWGPKGELAVVASEPTELGCRVEYPAGEVLCRVGNARGIRVSPDGRSVAITQEMRANHDSLLVLEGGAGPRTLVQAFGPLGMIAWSPGGEEVLFTSRPSPDETAICAVALDGRTREIYRADGSLSLCDVSHEGKLLLRRETNRLEMRCMGAGHEAEQDVSWLDGSSVAALSEDGRTIAFREMRSGGGPRGGVYLRSIDGSQPIWLGEGYTCDLSPDGKWVMTLDMNNPPKIVLLPTRAGRAQTVPIGSLHPWGGSFITNDCIAFDATGPDGKVRVCVARLDGSEPRLLTEDPITNGGACSPDGRLVALVRSDGQTFLYPVDGGQPQAVRGVEPEEASIQWSADGRFLYLRRFGELPVKVYRLDLETGERELWKTLMPADATGVIGIPTVVLTRTGHSYAYTCARIVSSELFVVEGLL